MTENRFYKYYFREGTKGRYLGVVEDSEQYEKMTGKDTVKWFKSFGKCYFRHRDNYDVYHAECHDDYITERFYNTLAELIAGEGLFLEELPAKGQQSFYGKAHRIVDKNGINLGLQSYKELVAIFKAGEGIEFTGYFSSTTTRHQDAYAFPIPCYCHYQNECDKVNKKFLDSVGFLWFAV